MCGTYTRPKLYAIELSYGNEIYPHADQTNYITCTTIQLRNLYLASFQQKKKIVLSRQKLYDFM